MALKAAIVMSAVSIALLLIYGADVIAAGDAKTGFIQLGPSLRGTIFGGISSVMLIISFFITRQEKSKRLGALILIGGSLIILGSAVILSTRAGQLETRSLVEFGSVLGVGIFIAVLGIIKIKK